MNPVTIFFTVTPGAQNPQLVLIRKVGNTGPIAEE